MAAAGPQGRVSASSLSSLLSTDRVWSGDGTAVSTAPEVSAQHTSGGAHAAHNGAAQADTPDASVTHRPSAASDSGLSAFARLLASPRGGTPEHASLRAFLQKHGADPCGGFPGALRVERAACVLSVGALLRIKATEALLLHQTPHSLTTKTQQSASCRACRARARRWLSLTRCAPGLHRASPVAHLRLGSGQTP